MAEVYPHSPSALGALILSLRSGTSHHWQARSSRDPHFKDERLRGESHLLLALAAASVMASVFIRNVLPATSHRQARQSRSSASEDSGTRFARQKAHHELHLGAGDRGR